MSIGWIIASSPSEFDSPTQYWSGEVFVDDLNGAEFFSTTRTVEEARIEEGQVQGQFTDRAISLLNVNYLLSLAADHETANGWILGAAPSHDDPVDQYLNDDGLVPAMDDAEVFSKTEGFTIDRARLENGAAQTRYKTLDVRLLAVNANITLI